MRAGPTRGRWGARWEGEVRPSPARQAAQVSGPGGDGDN